MPATNKRILAVDPGQSGSAVLISKECIIAALRDFKRLEDIAAAVSTLAGQADEAVIELVSAMPGQGVVSMFSFGVAVGFALGALRSNGFSEYGGDFKPLVYVHPLKWQNYFWKKLGIADRKRPAMFDSRAVAQLFFPAAAPYLTRIKDHNTADAILMGLWRLENPEAETSKREKRRRKKTLDAAAA